MGRSVRKNLSFLWKGRYRLLLILSTFLLYAFIFACQGTVRRDASSQALRAEGVRADSEGIYGGLDANLLLDNHDCPGCPKLATAFGIGTGTGKGDRMELLGGEGEEIPPICWTDGVITGVLRNPGSFDPARGQVSTITISVSQDVPQLTVRILNSLEQVVRVLYTGPASAQVPLQTIWNGTDTGGSQARYSIYLIDAVARDASSQVIGRGQCDVILYKPKAGISMQNADKFRDSETLEWLKSSDEFVAAGLVNPGDSVSVFFDNVQIPLANNEPNGIFRSQVLPYEVPGLHNLKITITPFGTQNSYDINWTVYLNQIEALGITVLRDGVPVQPPRNYFIPSEGETVRLDYSLDASEPDVRFLAVYVPYDGSDPVVVRDVTIGAQEGGVHSFVWDGLDNDGLPGLRGNYHPSVAAVPDLTSEIFCPGVIYASKIIELR